jgi:alkylhydroperoxidase family enzyme
MSRIPVHTIDSSPDASRPMLEAILKGPGSVGRVLNLHGQMAHAPAVLGAYLGIRHSIDEHATLDLATRAAVQLAVATADGCDYSQAINTMLVIRGGASHADVAAIRSGTHVDDPKLSALLDVGREAAALTGRVSDATWSTAIDIGWSDAQLAEVFVCVALTLFVDYFIGYAQTEIDIPVKAPAAQR